MEAEPVKGESMLTSDMIHRQIRNDILELESQPHTYLVKVISALRYKIVALEDNHKTQLARITRHSNENKKKIKNEQQKIRRLTSKNASLEKILSDFQEKHRYCDILGKNNLLDKLKTKRGRKSKNPNNYHDDVKDFASKLYLYSPRSYKLVRREMCPGLPHPKTIQSWYSAPSSSSSSEILEPEVKLELDPHRMDDEDDDENMGNDVYDDSIPCDATNDELDVPNQVLEDPIDGIEDTNEGQDDPNDVLEDPNEQLHHAQNDGGIDGGSENSLI